NGGQQSADLRRFHLAHLALRTHADDICRALAALRPGETDKAVAIGRLWMIYEAGSRGHDVAESALCWPVVAERDPSFADIQADLDALERRRQRMPKEMRVMFVAAEDGAARRANAPDLTGSLPLGDRIKLTLFWRRHYRRIVGPVLAIK